MVSYSYELPFKSEGWKEKAVGGWGISGVTTIQDGLPFTLVDGSGGTLLYGSIPPTGPYVRAELADPIDCNAATGNCRSGIPLGTTGSMNAAWDSR